MVGATIPQLEACFVSVLLRHENLPVSRSKVELGDEEATSHHVCHIAWVWPPKIVHDGYSVDCPQIMSQPPYTWVAPGFGTARIGQ